MANLIIKSSANDLVLKGSGQTGSDTAITVGATGTTTFAETVTFAGGKLFHGMTSITATGSTTWTKPAGVTAIMVYITGAGGGGGGGNPNYNSRGGGGAGGTAIKWITSGIGSTETVTIGTGGTAGAGNTGGSDGGDGTRGVTSSFGSHFSATGGYGGVVEATMISYVDSDRGNGVSGDINIFGGDGQNYQGGQAHTDEAGGSIGGGSYWGTGGMGGHSNGSAPGRPGRAYGSGGGGGDQIASGAAGAGGDGKSGICVIYTYIG
jgi:hypothetical protein